GALRGSLDVPHRPPRASPPGEGSRHVQEDDGGAVRAGQRASYVHDLPVVRGQVDEGEDGRRPRFAGSNYRLSRLRLLVERGAIGDGPAQEDVRSSADRQL